MKCSNGKFNFDEVMHIVICMEANKSFALWVTPSDLYVHFFEFAVVVVVVFVQCLQSIWSSDGKNLSTYLSATSITPSMRSTAYVDNGFSSTAEPSCLTDSARCNTGCTFGKDLNALAHVRSGFSYKNSVTKWSDIYSLVLLIICGIEMGSLIFLRLRLFGAQVALLS